MVEVAVASCRSKPNSKAWCIGLFLRYERQQYLQEIVTSPACFIHVQVCSGKIHFCDLQKFTLKTCSEKPEVDKMMLSLVSESQVIQ